MKIIIIMAANLTRIGMSTHPNQKVANLEFRPRPVGALSWNPPNARLNLPAA
jgi:hypothetical protein